jgi:hypothetical protein
LTAGTPCIVSDGPFLSVRIQGASKAAERSDRGIEIEAGALTEFGNIATVRLYAHRRGAPREDLLLDEAPEAERWSRRLDAPSGIDYLRAEAATSKGRRALTRAVVPG